MDVERADPVVVQVAADWLAQYARFLRRSPEIVEKLAQRPDEFELIPMPRMLLDRLAVPGIIDSGNLGGSVEDLERLMLMATSTSSSPEDAEAVEREAQAVIERLRAALESGNVDRLLALFSPEFLDSDGRDAEGMRATFDELIQASAERSLDVERIETTRLSAGEVMVCLKAVWVGRIGSEERGEDLREELELEVTLVRNMAGTWPITDIRAN